MQHGYWKQKQNQTTPTLGRWNKYDTRHHFCIFWCTYTTSYKDVWKVLLTIAPVPPLVRCSYPTFQCPFRSICTGTKTQTHFHCIPWSLCNYIWPILSNILNKVVGYNPIVSKSSNTSFLKMSRLVDIQILLDLEMNRL